MNEQPNITKAHCNECSGLRSHVILFDYDKKWLEEISDDPPDYIKGTDRYELLKCAGCDHVVFRHTATDSRYYDDKGNLEEIVTYSPPTQIRKNPRLFLKLVGGVLVVRKELSDLLDEIYVALHSECPRLAAMGIRSLIEHIVIEKVGDQGTFKKNLDKFKEEGFISESERILVDTTLEVGHASTHRNYRPHVNVLISCLDISEALINRLYIWPLQAKSIDKAIPKRQQVSGGNG